MAGISASIIFPYTTSSKISSGTSSPKWSQKRAVKWLCVIISLPCSISNILPFVHKTVLT